MSKLKYTNKSTGKTYTGEASDVAILQKNVNLSDRYVFEKEAEKPKEVISSKPSEKKESDK